MNINGTVVSIEMDITIPKKDGGNYPGCRFTYRDESGKLNEQAFHNNAFKFNPTLKTALKSLVAGDNISVVKEKNKNDFWEVKSITKVDASAPTAKTASAVASPKSTYETPEERAKKQVYIVRQSSIASAIAYAAAGGTNNSVEEILDLARQFEAHVFGTEYDDGSIASLKSDNLDDDVVF